MGRLNKKTAIIAELNRPLFSSSNTHFQLSSANILSLDITLVQYLGVFAITTSGAPSKKARLLANLGSRSCLL